jgi:hypothetical protein
MKKNRNIQDLLVQSRFRNAILWDLMAGRSASEVSLEVGCCKSQFGALLNLKQSPVLSDGTYRVTAQRIADYFKMLPEDLFPESLYALTLPDRVERTFDSEVVMLSLQAAELRVLPVSTDLDKKLFSKELDEKIGESLQTLTPREEKVIKLRFGLEDGEERTLEEVGRMMIGPVSGKPTHPAYVRQIEAKALRKLRQPARSRKLRPFLEEMR